MFKPRVVRFVLPRVFCHARGLPDGVLLKVRTEPGGAEGGGDYHQLEEPEASADGGGDGGRVLGRVGADQCVIGLAISGDWLQVSRTATPRRRGVLPSRFLSSIFGDAAALPISHNGGRPTRVR